MQLEPAYAQEALALVRRQPWGGAARVDENGALITPAPGGHGRDLNLFLVNAGFAPDSLTPETQDLEQVFLRPDQFLEWRSQMTSATVAAPVSAPRGALHAARPSFVGIVRGELLKISRQWSTWSWRSCVGGFLTLALSRCSSW